MTRVKFQNLLIAEFPRATSALNSYMQRPRLPAYMLIGNASSPVELLHYLGELALTVPGIVSPTVVDTAVEDYETLRNKLLMQNWPVYPLANQLWGLSESKCLFMGSGEKSTVVYFIDRDTSESQVRWINQNVAHRLSAEEHRQGDTAVILQEIPALEWMHGLNDNRKKMVFKSIVEVAHYWYPLNS